MMSVSIYTSALVLSLYASVTTLYGIAQKFGR